VKRDVAVPLPPEPGSLTEKQGERRQRVLQAAMELAREGGYEAVQMRAVAERAGVALGTVYRYFSSKDQMLSSVWSDWTEALQQRMKQSRPLEGTTRAELVLDFLLRETRPLERNPELAAALVTSWASSDPFAAGYQREVSSWMTERVEQVLEGLSPDEQHGIREVLAHVWHSVLLSWVKGRADTQRMHEILAAACHLLLDPRE
jgi:AcrR family transcriptional regulator